MQQTLTPANSKLNLGHSPAEPEDAETNPVPGPSGESSTALS